MKTLAFVLLAATLMVSCKKSEDNINEPAPLTSPDVVAKVNNVSVDYGVPMAEKQTSTSGTETVFINAATTDGKSIELSLSKDGGITTGTYGAANSAFVGVGDGTSYYGTANTVTIKITAVDATHIVGSFSGTGEDGTNTTPITEGRFYANF